jgi:hypothetical protein
VPKINVLYLSHIILSSKFYIKALQINMVEYDVGTLCWDYLHGVYFGRSWSTMFATWITCWKNQKLKKWLVLKFVHNTKAIGNELQCYGDRTHVIYNEEFIIVTNRLHGHVLSIMCMENSRIVRKGGHSFWHLNHTGWFLSSWHCFPVILVLNLLVVLFPKLLWLAAHNVFMNPASFVSPV